MTKFDRADDEEKVGGLSDFNLRIYPLQKLVCSSTRVAREFPIYDDQLKLVCLENALRMGRFEQTEAAKMWQVLSISLGDLNSKKKQLWSSHPLGWTLALKVLSHFQSKKDSQQVALVAALILGKENQIYAEQKKQWDLKRKEDYLKDQNK